jgi:hypothetical protein
MIYIYEYMTGRIYQLIGGWGDCKIDLKGFARVWFNFHDTNCSSFCNEQNDVFLKIKYYMHTGAFMVFWRINVKSFYFCAKLTSSNFLLNLQKNSERLSNLQTKFRLSPTTFSISILYIRFLQSTLKDFILYISCLSNNVL